MANALVGKVSVPITFLAKNDTAAEALRDFFVGHREFMEEKSYQNGPLSMVHYSISESPEYEQDDAAWAQGKYPKTTGKTIFHLYEIYESADGLHHHWIESAEFLPIMSELCAAHQIKLVVNNQMKVTQSLWE